MRLIFLELLFIDTIIYFLWTTQVGCDSEEELIVLEAVSSIVRFLHLSIDQSTGMKRTTLFMLI
jgi:hypothetical protein